MAGPRSEPFVPVAAEPPPGLLARFALRFTAWAERWIPDAFVFALLATFVIVVLGLLVAHATPAELVRSWGKGFWELVPFTMQMALIIVTGYVLASSRPVARLIARLARVPKTGRGAIAMVALFSMLASWINWGFSLIFGALLARETARRRPDADYRALAASSFLGLGSVWAQGLSGSAALQMATPGALQPSIRAIVAHDGVVPGGIVPLRHTIFLWQSFACVGIEVIVVTLLMWLAAPPPARARSAADLGIQLSPIEEEEGPERDGPRTPGEWLEHSPVLNLAIFGLGASYVAMKLVDAEDKLAAIDVNTINFVFLMLGMVFHWTPARLMRAVREATPATWGVVLQFPFYAGIAGLITYTHLNEKIAHFFVEISTAKTFPPLVAVYSAVLGVFVPSGGSKWVIEAPYVMAAAHEQQVHLGWVVAVYDLGEAIANLVQPFWMLPTLALFRLRARDVMGFTFVVFLVLLPIVLGLVTIMGATLTYPL